ncbi:TPA_inf: hypothetical protein gp_14 [Marinomonas phage YY]|uniref:Uncharacterized protein n=1 Tax=Marinomonas phage YY TaxID=2163588 RepID=A0A2S1GTT5_9VIRU|nr:hypothetical protein [Marinomonas phage YY]DBA35677.1 TPA_inf: hypothetical protein gp_14 [Marinomonas phage YY]
MTTEFLPALESVVLNSPPAFEAELPPMLMEPDAFAQYEPDAANAGHAPDMAPAAEVIDLLAEPDFLEQWALMHDMAGGMIQMRTGAPCPLGDQARSAGGMAAGKAAYQLISSNPALAKLILGTESTFLGQLAAIGMHGFACVQVVKASARGDTLPQIEPEKEAA